MLTFKCPNCGFSCHVLSYPVVCRCRARVEENGEWRVLPPATEVPVVNLTCIHRSGTYRLVDCTDCRGKVQLKVYQCKRNGECTVERELAGVHVCNGNTL